MIQRIQSIFLLAAAILMAVTAFSPVINLIDDCILFSYGIKNAEELIKPTWGIVSMAVIAALLSLISVFLYKNRKLQSRMTIITVLIILFYYITAVVYLSSYYASAVDAFKSVAYGSILPIAAIIFLLLANRAISKDEKLVRSLDRIR